MPFLSGGDTVAYAGYLIKVGNYKFPMSKMRAESYEVTLGGQDLDSYRDANGLLHRNSLKNVLVKVEFETPAMLTDRQVSTIMSHLRENYIGKDREKACNVTMYIPELDKYVTHKCYVPDVTMQMYSANEDKILYNPIRFAFIGYGAEAW